MSATNFSAVCREQLPSSLFGYFTGTISLGSSVHEQMPLSIRGERAISPSIKKKDPVAKKLKSKSNMLTTWLCRTQNTPNPLKRLQIPRCESKLRALRDHSILELSRYHTCTNFKHGQICHVWEKENKGTCQTLMSTSGPFCQNRASVMS